MPRNAQGVYSLPPGTAAVPNELAAAEAVNDRFNDVAADLNFLGGRVQSVLPIGGIIMWSGSTVGIPTGWALCNGQNGTPDLRNRFIVGAGSGYNSGDTGGAETVTLTQAQLPAHTHDFSATTSTAGNHGHTGATSFQGDHTHPTYGAGAFYANHNPGSPAVGFGSGGNYFPMSPQPTILGAGGHSHTLSIDAAGAHSHTVSGATSGVGSGAAHENRPPYYALAYIMRIS